MSTMLDANRSRAVFWCVTVTRQLCLVCVVGKVALHVQARRESQDVRPSYVLRTRSWVSIAVQAEGDGKAVFLEKALHGFCQKHPVGGDVKAHRLFGGMVMHIVDNLWISGQLIGARRRKSRGSGRCSGVFEQQVDGAVRDLLGHQTLVAVDARRAIAVGACQVAGVGHV